MPVAVAGLTLVLEPRYKHEHGGADLIYKPETVVDLDTGAVVQAQVQPGDHTDHHGMATRILEAQESINEARGEATDILTVETVTADKGYSHGPDIFLL